MVAFKRAGAQGGAFRFRVSDSVGVPLRGQLLRLRLLDGEPSLADLDIGRRLRLIAPGGRERVVTITAHATTGGRQTQERLNRTRELDVIVSDSDARGDGALVDIGWVASGPVTEGGREGDR